MVCLLAAATLSLLGPAQSLPAKPAIEQQAPPPVGAVAPSPLPPIPRGKSTVIGGEIRDVDPVRDEFTLKVFGGRSMKILYDERTQVFRDGARMPVLKLHSEDHASVETTLDGTKIFAIRIHMLSQLPEGQYEGQVVSYNRQTEEIILRAPASKTSITLRVPAGTPVMRLDRDPLSDQQPDPSNFAPGSMVDVTFNGGRNGLGVATEVDVLASPGSVVTFRGKLSFLDLESGRLVIVGAKGDESHEVVYDASRFPVSRMLHDGSEVKVTASFDGSRYVADSITVE